MTTLYVDNIAPNLQSRVSVPGHVIQVVSVTNGTQTDVTNTSSFVDTPVTATITPVSTSSQILVRVTPQIKIGNNSGAASRGFLKVDRDSGAASSDEQRVYLYDYGLSGSYLEYMLSMDWLDSPATTSPVTYTLQLKLQDGNSISCSYNNSTSTITLMEIAG
jgi:hypothetical protein